jgi:hypothetical protein
MGELNELFCKLDELPVDPQARLGYDVFAGGLKWSDEMPEWTHPDVPEQDVPGLGTWRALLNYRSSLIVNQPREKFRDLWERAMQSCPRWPGFLPERRDPSLAARFREFDEAALRSFEELDARMERQRQAAAHKASA